MISIRISRLIPVLVTAIAVTGCGALGPSSSNTAASNSGSQPSSASQQVTTIAQVEKAVAAAQNVKSLPSNLTPALVDSGDKAWAGAPVGPCHQLAGDPAGVPSGLFGGCLFGDYNSKKLMVVYGDSHSGMWASSLEAIAVRDHWALRMFALPFCPPEDLKLVNFGQVNTKCAAFHHAALAAIRAMHPKLLVVTGQTVDEQSAPGVFYNNNQWRAGLVRTLRSLKEPGTKTVVIGNIPEWSKDDADCLAAHESSVQSCMVTRKQGTPPNIAAEGQAARITGSGYINPIPWVCGHKCVPVVGNMRLFLDQYHFTKTYAVYLSGALAQALGLGQ